MIKKLILILITTIALSATTSATVGYYETPPWYWYDNPDIPPDGNCYDTIFSNLTPSNEAFDIEITAKGVLICANITPPQGCNITIQYQWFNWTQYLNDFIIWANSQPWGEYWDYEEWVDDIDWDNRTDPTNSSYWYNFTALYENINTTTQVCDYNENVSCHIEGDWTTDWFDWRINWTMNCSGNITTGDCYYYFEPEICSVIQYIYPPSPNGTICPCCADMCVSINNTLGNPMNITFYRNDTQFTDYYIINELHNLSNGTYCFCIDGHINTSLYYPMRFNEIYHWYVNITDTVTLDYLISDIFTFRTYPDDSWCPCGPEDFVEWDTDYDTISDEVWILPLSMMFLLIVPLIYRRRKR